MHLRSVLPGPSASLALLQPLVLPVIRAHARVGALVELAPGVLLVALKRAPAAQGGGSLLLQHRANLTLQSIQVLA